MILKKDLPVVFVATSKRFYPLAIPLVDSLKTLGLRVYHPYFELDPKEVDADPERKREVTIRHFEELDQCDLVYALLPGGYIGISVTMELAYAYGREKHIISSELPDEYAVRPMISDVMNPDLFLRQFTSGHNFQK